jgi:hypothetical protein
VPLPTIREIVPRAFLCWSTATPSGPPRVALVAGPPSPHEGADAHTAPVPAIRVIAPPGANLRISLSPSSPMETLPDLSTATPNGELNWAAVALPPSPQWWNRQLGGVAVGRGTYKLTVIATVGGKALTSSLSMRL